MGESCAPAKGRLGSREEIDPPREWGGCDAPDAGGSHAIADAGPDPELAPAGDCEVAAICQADDPVSGVTVSRNRAGTRGAACVPSTRGNRLGAW